MGYIGQAAKGKAKSMIMIWPAFGWGIGIVFHALSVFEISSPFGPEWEQKQIEKRLRK